MQREDQPREYPPLHDRYAPPPGPYWYPRRNSNPPHPSELLAENAYIKKENKNLQMEIRAMEETLENLKKRVQSLEQPLDGKVATVPFDVAEALLAKYTNAIQYALNETVRLAMTDFAKDLNQGKRLSDAEEVVQQ